MGKHVPSLAAQNLDLRAHALAIIVKSLILKKEDNFLDIEIQETGYKLQLEAQILELWHLHANCNTELLIIFTDTIFPLGRLTEYQVIGRHLPTETNPTPKLYRMLIFAPNDVVAKSRFWYFLMKLRKVKKANGEIISLNVIHEKRPQKVKNFGIWIRYDSRSGTHNMYKEYREMSRTDAVEALYQDMAARHRARFRSIHILKVVEIEKTADIRRPYIKQLLTKNLKFPLPHRIAKKSTRSIFSAHRPTTFN